MNVLSLFSGIGGLDLGLERAGMQIVGFCENEPYCQKVLHKHWPNVPLWPDVTTLTAEWIAEHCGRVDLICGGFPCQDLSHAGKQAGIDGERSGLFREIIRLLRVVRPHYCLLENVPALLARPEWMGAVLGELAESGYDARWDCVPAAAVGAPHIRDRVFIVGILADADESGLEERRGKRGNTQAQRQAAVGDGCEVPDTERARRAQLWQAGRMGRIVESVARNGGRTRATEPDVGRVAHGVPARVDRLRALGNAVVPQVAEVIGRWIMEYETCRHGGSAQPA